MSLVVFGINFLMGGIFWPFIKVKMSRGKKILVRVLNPVQTFYRVGEVREGFLVYKDREGNNRRIRLQPNCIDRGATIYWITADDEKNCLLQRHDNKEIDGYDAAKYDDLYKRALYKPNLLDDRIHKIMLLVVLLNTAALLFIGFLIFKLDGRILQILEIVQGAGVGVIN